MLVKRLVLFVLLPFIDLGIFLSLGSQVRLSCAFRADRAQRNHFLQILMLTGRALRRGRRRKHQILELMPAGFTLILVDWHSSPQSILVSGFGIDQIQQCFIAFEATQVLAEQIYHLSPVVGANTGRMR